MSYLGNWEPHNTFPFTATVPGIYIVYVQAVPGNAYNNFGVSIRVDDRVRGRFNFKGALNNNNSYVLLPLITVLAPGETLTSIVSDNNVTLSFESGIFIYL